MPRVPDFAPTPALVSFPTWLLGGKSRSGRQIAPEQGAVAARKVSICMWWACVPALATHRGHWLGCTQCAHRVTAFTRCGPGLGRTHWVPAVPSPSVVGLGASCPLLACRPPLLHHLYKFISNPRELQSELGCQTSSFEVLSCHLVFGNQLWQGLQRGKADAMRLLVVFLTNITSSS